MPGSIIHWRSEIGVFNARLNAKHVKLKYDRSICFAGLCPLFIMGYLLLLLLICDCDIELNPGQKKRDSSYNLSVCHWNLNSIAAHDFSQLTLLEAYNMKHNFDIICLSETYPLRHI